ncbi:MAG: hypothetical protein ACRDRL_03220, partial [Sciscionella sp.]
DRYSIQLGRCLKTSKKGTPMKTTKRALKAAALAAVLIAMMLLSTGCVEVILGGATPGGFLG